MPQPLRNFKRQERLVAFHLTELPTSTCRELTKLAIKAPQVMLLQLLNCRQQEPSVVLASMALRILICPVLMLPVIRTLPVTRPQRPSCKLRELLTECRLTALRIFQYQQLRPEDALLRSQAQRKALLLDCRCTRHITTAILRLTGMCFILRGNSRW